MPPSPSVMHVKQLASNFIIIEMIAKEVNPIISDIYNYYIFRFRQSVQVYNDNYY